MDNTANRIFNKLNHWSSMGGLFFLLLLLAVFLNEHINAIRNIGLYSLAIMIILYSVTCRWKMRNLDGYRITLILLTILIIQGAVRNEYGITEGFNDFRRTYMKAYIIAIGIMLFVSNIRAVSLVTWSLFVSAISILSNEIYRYLYSSGNTFFYGGEGGIRLSAHVIDFIDPVVVLYTKHHSKYIRFLSIVVLIGFTVLIIGTGTRGGWLALAAGFVVVYFLVNKDGKLVSTLVKSSIRIAAIAIGISLLAPSGSMVDNAFNKRLDAVKRTETIFPVYGNTIVHGPAFGYGYTNNIEDRIPNIVGATDEQFGLALRHGPHNQFLLFGVHFGIIGLIIYIVVIVWTLIRLIRRSIFSPDFEMRLLSAGGAGMLVAEYIVRSMTDLTPKHWIGVPIGIALITLPEKGGPSMKG